MKKMLVIATALSSALLLNAAETHQSTYAAAGKLVKAKKYLEGAAKYAEAGKLAEKQYDKFWSAYEETAAYMNAKQYDKAEAAAENELKIALSTGKQVGDQQARAYWQLGVICYTQKKYEKAAEYYKKSVALAPKKSWILQNSATAAGNILNNNLKKTEEAKAMYKQLADDKEAEPDVRITGLFNYAVANVKKSTAPATLKELENAETKFGKISKNSLAKIWDARGRNYYALNQWDEAIRAFNEVVKLTEPESSYQAHAYSNLMICSLYKKDQAAAALYAQKALDCKKATWGRDVKRCKQVIADYQKTLKK